MRIELAALVVVGLAVACQSTVAQQDAAPADAALVDLGRAPDSATSCGNLGAACGPGAAACGPGLKCCNAAANCSDANPGYCFPSDATWDLTGTCPAGHCAAPKPICLMGCPGCDFSTCVTDAQAACLCSRMSFYGCP